MHTGLFVLLAVTLSVCGCRQRGYSLPENCPEAETLRWLDHADVIADFTKQVEQKHDYRFVSVQCITNDTIPGSLGLPDTSEVRGLVGRHGQWRIKGITDGITCAEQERLIFEASDYAKQYNILLLHYLREHPNT